MEVKDIMTPNPVTVEADTPIGKISDILYAERIWSVFVTENGKLKGIVTKNDLKRRAWASGKSRNTPVSDIMSRDVKYVNPSADVEDVIGQLRRHRINELAVVKDGALCGIVTRYDIKTRYYGQMHRMAVSEGIKTNASIGNNMAQNNSKILPEYTSPKESAGFWSRVFHTRDPDFWKELFQKELDTRWHIFDANLENLNIQWENFKKIHMEVAETESGLRAYEREWDKSLTSLGNLLNKNAVHEKMMWDTTQKNRKVKGLKVNQKFRDSDVDEIRFNNMIDYIKQYPELQAQRTIDRSVDNVRDKRSEVLSAQKAYDGKIKETNTYLNTAKSKLQKVEHQLDSFETIKTEGEKKIKEEQSKLSFKIRSALMTAAEKESLKLFLFEFDRKIEESRDQLKLMRDDLKEYEKREFKPIVTKKFAAIEE
jgi:CBS domain-containing protein